MASNQEDPPRETHSDANHEEDDPAPLLSEPITSKEWWGLVRYFLGGLAVALFFFFMMANGPKGVLAGGTALLAGLLVWLVYRFVFRSDE
ncbi:MAG: hypothetical protein M0041_02330 [Nitrospiraceae bacterium]|jgi:hypothetical protein|nr:hypothetical protein [Nitrospiraceae bacterium]